MCQHDVQLDSEHLKLICFKISDDSYACSRSNIFVAEHFQFVCLVMQTDKASMLDEIIDYVKFLQLQVKVNMALLARRTLLASLVHVILSLL